MTVLRSRVSKRLGLDETASGAEETLLTYELNDAVRDFLIRTRCNVNKATDTIDTAGGDQDLSSTALLVLDISITGSDSTVRIPQRTSRAHILEMRRATATTVGASRWYAHEGSLWSFYPDLAVNDVVTLYYVPRPTEMSTGTHDPATETYGNIPVEFHPALIEYAAWKMADYDDDQSSQNGMVYAANYERLVRQALKNLRQKGGRSLGRVVIGRRAPVRSSPSQDLW